MKTEGWLCSLCKLPPNPLLSLSSPPNTTIELHTPTPQSWVAAPPPSYTHIQLPADASYVCSPSAGANLQTSGPCLISVFTTWHPYHPTANPTHSPSTLRLTLPPAPPAFSYSNTQTHIHTPQVCFDTWACRTGTQRLTVRNKTHIPYENFSKRLRIQKGNKYVNVNVVLVRNQMNQKGQNSFLIFSNLVG